MLLSALSLETETAGRYPPAPPRSAGGLSGRPFCRIYFELARWVLEVDPRSVGWPVQTPDRANRRFFFKTFIEAVAYAQRHGFDYRVVPPPLLRERIQSRARQGGSRKRPFADISRRHA